MTTVRQNYNGTAVSVRNTNANDTDVVLAKNHAQCIVHCVSTLDKAGTLYLYGDVAEAMTNPVLIDSASVSIGSVTTQVEAIMTEARYPYYKGRFTAGDTPTAGDMTLYIRCPRK